MRSVWELTAYTNDHVFLTGCFSGELHLPIRQLGVSYGLISLAELPPPDISRFTLQRGAAAAGASELR